MCNVFSRSREVYPYCFFFYDLVHGTKPVPCFPVWISLADYSDLIGKVEHPSEAEVKRILCFVLRCFFLLYSHLLKELCVVRLLTGDAFDGRRNCCSLHDRVVCAMKGGKPLYRNNVCSMASIVNHAFRTWPTVVTGHPSEKSKVVALHIYCFARVKYENRSLCISMVFRKGHHPDPLSLSTTVLISRLAKLSLVDTHGVQILSETSYIDVKLSLVDTH